MIFGAQNPEETSHESMLVRKIWDTNIYWFRKNAKLSTDSVYIKATE